MKKILIFGATSAIAIAVARLWAREKYLIYAVARNLERLDVLAADLRVRGAAIVHTRSFDANELELHERIIDEAATALGGIDLIFISHGTLSDQERCEKDSALMVREFSLNALTTMSILTHAANYLESQKRGSLAVISSVAGDRGRKSNYVYGAAKGAVTIFLQGLRQRLQKSGISVLAVKPGFIDTPMTAKMQKGFLWSTPEKIAPAIIDAIDKGQDEIYVPAFWRFVMAAIKMAPERIFKRLSL